ncbi:MAG TPA: hypothetical protein VF383_09665 [Candidatus Dormibacteraeota bacterium]
MTTGQLPDPAFMYAVAGLSLTLAGFSGLVVAFRHEGALKAVDAYRLVQIPEMALVTTLLSLIPAPLSEWVGTASAGIRITAGLALLFTIGHVLVLITRMREGHLQLPQAGVTMAGVLDIAIMLTGAICLGVGSALSLDWLLILLLARPMLAFALVVADVASGSPAKR